MVGDKLVLLELMLTVVIGQLINYIFLATNKELMAMLTRMATAFLCIAVTVIEIGNILTNLYKIFQ